MLPLIHRLILITAAAILAVLISPAAEAQICRVRSVYQGCQQVQDAFGNCRQFCKRVNGYGTAFNIGQRVDRPGHYLFATCAHCISPTTTVDNTKCVRQKVELSFDDGWKECEIIGVSKHADCALLSATVSDPKVYSVNSIPTGRWEGRTIGFSGELDRWRTPNYHSWQSTSPYNGTMALRSIDDRPRDGESGGPLLVSLSQGRQSVVGLVTGYNDEPPYRARFVKGDEIIRVRNTIFAGWYNKPPTNPTIRNPSPVVPDPDPEDDLQPTPDVISQRPREHRHPELDKLDDVLKELRALRTEINVLQADNDELRGKLAKAKVPVELVDPDGNVVSRQDYPLGTPLRFEVSRPAEFPPLPTQEE